jgi:protein-S-isoprenylcysteine O-methyltransferase Ste14
MMALSRPLLSPLPSRATLVSAAALLAAFFIAFHYAAPSPASVALGLPLIALGMAIRLATNATLRKNEATFRRGLYAVCRHPMYVGTLAIAAGIAIVLRHPVALLLFLAALAICAYRIRKEEAFLSTTLADYAAYREQVPALPTPASLIRAGARLREPLSLRQCYLNGEILRFNLYLPLLVAAGLYFRHAGELPLPAVALAGGAGLGIVAMYATGLLVSA